MCRVFALRKAWDGSSMLASEFTFDDYCEAAECFNRLGRADQPFLRVSLQVRVGAAYAERIAWSRYAGFPG